MKYTLLTGAAMLVAAGLVTGCHEKKEVRYDDEVYDDVYIAEPPPPLIVETCPPCPNETFVWVGGFWFWNNNHYVWRKGRWAPPPPHHGYWYPPEYRKYKHGYRYQPGYWDKKPPKHHNEPPKHHDNPPPPKHDKHYDKHDKHYDRHENREMRSPKGRRRG